MKKIFLVFWVLILLIGVPSVGTGRVVENWGTSKAAGAVAGAGMVQAHELGLGLGQWQELEQDGQDEAIGVEAKAWIGETKDGLVRAESSYAYIEESTTLYSLPENGLAGGESVAVTSLPSTYFCEILGEVAEYSGYYKVGYLDIVGLVKKESVSIVDYTPKYKFASAKIRIAEDVTGVNLRTEPNHKTGSVVYTATGEDKEFIWYGEIVGSIPIQGIDIDRWYYTRLVKGDTTYYGYVYSAYMMADTIPPNVIEPIEDDTDGKGAVDTMPAPLEGVTLYIVIGALSLPAVLIIWLLFRKRPNKAAGS